MMRIVCKSYIWLLIELISLLVLAIFTASAMGNKVACEPVEGSNCSCKLSNNQGTFDLQGLVADTVKPRFAVNQIDENVTYFYDPCREFSYLGCEHAAACTVTDDSQTRIAVFDNLVYDYEDTQGKVLKIIYTNGEDPSISTSVLYQCDLNKKEPVLIVDLIISGNYSFRVISPDFCNQPYQPQHHVSFGTFLCITVPTAFLCYFSCGFLYLFFVKHESWRNAMPHHQFWCGLPGLIRDGASYSWAFITCRSGDTSNGYDQI